MVAKGSRHFAWLEMLLLAAAGIAWCVYRSKAFILNPFQTAWMMEGDWAMFFNAQNL
jgi:hypothetical protein